VEILFLGSTKEKIVLLLRWILNLLVGKKNDESSDILNMSYIHFSENDIILCFICFQYSYDSIFVKSKS